MGFQKTRPFKQFAVIDFVLIVSLLIGSAVSFPLVWSSPGGTTVQVFCGKALRAEYPLDNDRRFFIRGELGEVAVEIADQKAAIVSSSCPRGLCMQMGEIGKAGRQIVCAPNHLIVKVVQKGTHDTWTPDAVTP